MATLTRLRPPPTTTQLNVLHETVPAPFPVDLLEQGLRQREVKPLPPPQLTAERPALLEAESSGEVLQLSTEGLTPAVDVQTCLSREVNVSPSIYAQRLLTLQADLGRTFGITFLRPAILLNDPQQANFYQRGRLLLAANPP